MCQARSDLSFMWGCEEGGARDLPNDLNIQYYFDQTIRGESLL